MKVRELIVEEPKNEHSPPFTRKRRARRKDISEDLKEKQNVATVKIETTFNEDANESLDDTDDVGDCHDRYECVQYTLGLALLRATVQGYLTSTPRTAFSLSHTHIFGEAKCRTTLWCLKIVYLATPIHIRMRKREKTSKIFSYGQR